MYCKFNKSGWVVFLILQSWVRIAKNAFEKNVQVLALPLDNAIIASLLFLSCGIFQIVKCGSKSYSLGKFYKFQFSFLTI